MNRIRRLVVESLLRCWWLSVQIPLVTYQSRQNDTSCSSDDEIEQGFIHAVPCQDDVTGCSIVKISKQLAPSDI